jgi:serine/threonine-protein kinase
MGVVWAATNERTEREVALKLINGENDALRRRLLREARACGRLTHRNIIEILDVGETQEGEPFLVMPLLSGETLADRLARDGLLPPPLCARIAADIARGLEAAHAAGIIHRDLKPANVFLHREPGNDDDFVVKVLDFGVSKSLAPADAGAATMTGGAVGSPLYMSPEQAIGDAGVGPRADLWALGVLLFEMLTGTRPFYASTAFAVVAKILRGPIPTVLSRAPGVDPALGAVVARCLVRRPADRIASATELCAALLPFAGARERPAPPAPMPAPPPDDDEPTGYFRKPSRARADEMLAAADVLAAPEAFSPDELHASSELLSSADLIASAPIPLTSARERPPTVEGTLPLPDVPMEGEAAPSSADPASSVTPLVQQGEAQPAGDDFPALRSRSARRTGLWIGLGSVVALALAGGVYLSSSSTPSPPPAPAVSVRPAPPEAPPPPAVSATPSPPVPASAAYVPASASAAAPPPSAPRPPPPPAGRPTPAPTPKPGGKIIRETPF